jgi:hypothetical protein
VSTDHQTISLLLPSRPLLSPCIMASRLCCTAEQDGREGSPELPNARVSASVPANLPLLPTQSGSPNSHFTSARSEDLHELRQIFDNARDDGPDTSSPPKVPRTRHSRASIYSLHSLHKMTSMRSILRRKFSKDMPKKSSDASVRLPTAERPIDEEPDTVIKRSNEEPKQQLKVTKEDLRKDLLSDKKPAEGGYDSDAEVLDDVARNIGKKTPNKRPSIHSVDWSPSTGRLVFFTQLTSRHLLISSGNRLQVHQLSAVIALSSNATSGPTRSRSLSYRHCLLASPKFSVRPIYVRKMQANAIASYVDLTQLRQWVCRSRLHFLRFDCPV